jgi:propionyl-CoA carboxylase alpha chain
VFLGGVGPLPAVATGGQKVRAGEALVVIEALKMQNIVKAENDCVVAEVLARAGNGLTVDQPILRFR